MCWGFVKHAGMLRAPGVFLPDKKPSLVALTFLHTNVCLEFAPVCLVLALDLYHCSVGKYIWVTELSVPY